MQSHLSQAIDRSPARPGWPWTTLLCALLTATTAFGADLPGARKRLAVGAYEEVIATTIAGRREASGDVEWPLLLGDALGRVGRYEEASQALEEGCKKFPLDIRLRFAAWQAAQDAGRGDLAKKQLAEFDKLATNRLWAYRTPAERITLGRAALVFHSDPKKVLDQFFDPIRKTQPDLRDSYLATGELALDKNNFALAAKNFAAATKKFPDDADAWFGLARAYESSDTEAMMSALDKTFALNPNHLEAWLLLANHRIDAEEYGEADKALAAALKINPNSPAAHACRAVLAHLRNDAKTENDARAAALKLWKNNPEVPFLIGRKLSQKYRFAEGAARQQEALQFDPQYLPAKAQLANDLLRLGQDDEGWKLAGEVQTADPYDVVAYNLTTLHDVLGRFRTLNGNHFTVRMDPREADIYGDDTLALLERAHSAMTAKYGIVLPEKTIVEIFPEQKDFAIRTFGLPGGSGYLGVCFGRVITANSPASRTGSPSNWEAILWHEFTHVITLTMTKNKMPRWLSEGISVFEERQARTERSNITGSWGEQMKPRYRAMILGEDLTPVSQLSSAFLQPKTPAHLGFAYYESSLVVEWLVQRWGLEKMRALLVDLSNGTEINTALTAQFAPIAQLDADFAKHVKELATNTGPKLDWTPPKPAELASAKGASEFLARSPTNYAALTEQARQFLEAKQWQAAKAPLQKLVELYPDQYGAESAYGRLAAVHRELGEKDAEFAVLTKYADLAPEATDAFFRLMQIYAERKDWAKVLDYSARYLAVDPLRTEPHRYEAEASEALHQADQAIAAYRALLKLGSTDLPETHFRLARLLHEKGDPAAKREVLLALEEAPRFRAAQTLLLQIADQASAPSEVNKDKAP